MEEDVGVSNDEDSEDEGDEMDEPQPRTSNGRLELNENDNEVANDEEDGEDSLGDDPEVDVDATGTKQS